MDGLSYVPHCLCVASLITVVKKMFGAFTAKNRIKGGGKKQRNQ